MTDNITNIMEEYNMVKVSEGYYRTAGGRAYVKADENGFKIYSCNGNYKGYAENFRLACIRAERV